MGGTDNCSPGGTNVGSREPFVQLYRIIEPGLACKYFTGYLQRLASRMVAAATLATHCICRLRCRRVFVPVLFCSSKPFDRSFPQVTSVVFSPHCLTWYRIFR